VRELFCDTVKNRRWWQTWGAWIFAAAIVATVVASVVYASQGAPDPTDATAPEPHAVIVANSAIIVFREGLEAVLILAAVMAPMLGAGTRLKRPIAAGAALGFGAALGTWFAAQAILSQFTQHGDRLQAVTGLIAIAVLLVVMNWFFHKVYWTKWIGNRNAQRKRALARAETGFLSAQLLGLVLLGAGTLQDVGWLSRTPVGVQFPDWCARWFEVVPTWETLGAQLLAAALVVGSYFAAEYVRVRAPRRRGDEPAVRTTEPSLSR
jgi:high-affinity Fe2+/Pb2+ permease